MKNNYKLITQLSIALMCFMMVFANKMNAQVSTYTFAQSSGTFSPITGGSTIGTTTADDNTFGALNIGFNFVYNGVTYTQFGLNANGWISMGAGVPASSYTAISTGTTNNIIAGLNNDIILGFRFTGNTTLGSNVLTSVSSTAGVLVGGAITGAGIPAGTTITGFTVNTITLSAPATSTGAAITYTLANGEMRYQTLGLAPNRVCVVQWLRTRRFAQASMNLEFQIRLYETSNIVEVAYGVISPNATTSTYQVGLRGNSNADFNNRTTTTNWATTTAGATNAATCSMTNLVFPATAQTYTWTPAAPAACPAPTLLTATGITSTTANLGWTCTTCTGTFALEYGPTGFTPGTGTIVTPATSPVAVSGLTAGTTYQFYVIQDCSGTGAGFSVAAGPSSFTTHALGDDVCTALPLIFGTNGPYNSAGSTIQVGEPAAPAGGCNTQTTWCNSTLNGSYWFTFVAPASGRVSIAAPGFDDQIALYSAANCTAILSGGSTLIAANDDGGASFSAVINPVNCLSPGVTYFVQVDQYSAATGTYTVVLTDLGPANPSFTGLAATYCSDAAAVTLTPAVTGGVFAGTGVTGSSFNPTTAGAGTYSVTYTLNGCYTSTQSVTVNALPVASSSSTPILCNGGTSTVTVSATGGTPSYTGTGTFTAPAGAYSYTVTDANSCSSTTTGTITQPTAVAVTTTSSAILCNGGTSTVTIAASGGTPSYTGTGSFTQSAGTTVYTVTDANSCVGTASVVITEPTAVMVMFSSTPILCNGGTSSVTISGMDGTPGYTGEGTFTQSAGTTVYTVTDANSCTGTASVVLTQPTLLVASSSSGAIMCNGGTATVTVSATGGTPSYSGTGTFSQPVGSNTYTVTDANGCSTTTSTTLTEPTAIVVTSSETGVLCNGGTSSVTIVASGGTPGYLGQGTFTQSAGTTTYTVTDANACTSSLAVTVVEPTAMSTSSSITSAIMCNGGSGSVTITATGGTTPYTNDGSFTQSAGTTSYTVTDANGCTSTTTATLTEPTAVMVMFSSTPILCNGDSSAVTISGMDGTPGYTGTGTFNQAAGTVTYSITDANGCVGSANVAVTQPAAITTSQSVNLCGGQSVTVGTSTYTTAGTYTDILTAANSCDSTVTTTVTATTVNATTTTAGAVITANSSAGTFQWLDCNLASAPIAGSTSSVYTATANGSYAVEVTDNGCVDTSACVVISTTGIANNSENVLSVYPNPTIGVFNISISNANISELLITIVDIQGKEVFSSVDKNVNGTFNKQINLEEISKGLYYIKVNTGAEVNIQKLIIQ